MTVARFWRRTKRLRRPFNKPGDRPVASGPRFEEIENRLLFSADLPGIIGVTPPVAGVGQTHEGQVWGADGLNASLAEADTVHREIVFIDGAVENARSLIADLLGSLDPERQVEIVSLDLSRDGVDQIGEYLAGRGDVDTIRIFAHGEEGGIALGSSRLDLDRLLADADAVADWGAALSANADLLIYGCEVAGDADGENFLLTLSSLTGADVAASVDLTGSASAGGDWNLEFRTGDIESSAFASTEWQGTLLLQATNLDAPESYVEDVALDLTDIVIGGTASPTVSVVLTLSDPAAGTLSADPSLPADWSFSDGVWSASGQSADVNAALSTLRFTPSADYNSNFSVEVRVDDGLSAALVGVKTFTGVAVNDAPVLDASASLSFTPIFENDFSSAGESAGDVFGNAAPDAVSDVDGTHVDGFAIVGADDSNGVWQYSTDNGGSWNDIGAVSDTSAILLKGPAKLVRFVPDAGFSGTADITIRAWDGTQGGNGAVGVDTSNNGGITAFSADTADVSIEVLPRSVSMLFSTSGDVANSGQDVKSWSSGSIIGLGEPNIRFEPGSSDGTFSLTTDLDGFAADGQVNVAAVHWVGGNVTLGTHETVDLQHGDILFSVVEGETLTSTNSLSFGAGDIVAFRPDVPGDYSSGTFIHVLDNPGTSVTTGISLVERSTVVGDVTLGAGTLVFAQAGDTSVYHMTVDEAGAGVTSGTVSTLLDFSDLAPGFSGEISGVHLVTAPFDAPGMALGAGTLILGTTATGDLTVGDNGVVMSQNDLVALSLVTTGMGSTGHASGEATLFFEGDDLGLSSPREQLRSVTLVNHEVDIIAGGESYVLDEDSTFTATLGVDDLLGNDSDVDGDTLTVAPVPVSGPSHGSLQLNPDGTFTYTPDADFNGTDSFTYRVTDGHGHFGEATATLVVNPVNDDPTVQGESYRVAEDGVLTATLGVDDLLGNDSDVDGDTLTVAPVPVSGPSHGSLQLNPDGTFTYTPDADFNGTDSFTYRVTDGQGGTATGLVSITVSALNDAPVFTSFSGFASADLAMDELQTYVGVISAIDRDGDTVTVRMSGNDAAQFAFDPQTGRLAFNVPPDFEAPGDVDSDNRYEVTLTASDGQLFSTQTLSVSVANINEAPVAQDQSLAVSAETPPGDVIGIVQSTDPDRGDALSFTVVGGDPAFVVDSQSGAISVADGTDLGLEVGREYFVDVNVADSHGLNTTATVSIEIVGEPGVEPQLDNDPVPYDTATPRDPGLGGGQSSYDPDGVHEQVLPETDSGSREPRQMDEPDQPPPPSTPIEPIPDTADLEQSQDFAHGGLPQGRGAPSADSDDARLPASGAAPGRDLRAIFRMVFHEDDSENEAGDWADERLRFKEAQLQLGLGGLGNPDLDTAIDLIDKAGDEMQESHLFVSKTATAATLTLTAGVVAWTLRSGALVASLFASSPLLLQFDPLPVLAREDDEGRQPASGPDDPELLFGSFAQDRAPAGEDKA